MSKFKLACWLDDAYSATKLITESFNLDNLVSMIAKNIQKFNHRPYHVPPSIKEYLRVRDKQHGKDPKLPHPIKKRKHRDMYNMEVQDELVEKYIWDDSYEDTEGSQQPH